MCLEADTKAKRKFKRRNVNQQSIIAYKVYGVSFDRNTLYSTIMSTIIKRHGWIVSDRKGGTRVGSDEFDYYYDDYEPCRVVKRGIHVYLNIKDAINSARGSVIVSVQCRIDDLIAIDKKENNAVFTKVYLNKENFRRAMQE